MIKITSPYRCSAFILVVVGVILSCGVGPVLRSERLGSDGSSAGVYVGDYQLARTVLPVTLKKLGDAYAIEIGEPRAAGDPSAAFVVRYEGSPFAEDDFTIEVDSKTRLLKSIMLKTTEKTDEIIVKMAESLALLESAPAQKPAEEILISAEIDPNDHDQVKSLAKAMAIASEGKGKVKDFVVTQVRKDAHGAAQPWPDCSIGFCYRASVPYRISFEFENGRKFEKEIGLPNGGPVIAVPLTRAAFVEKVTNITFVDGTPNQIALNKPSEALDFVSIPLEVAKAILRVPAELIKLKFDISDEEKKLAISEKARIEAERELKKTRSDTALESGPLKIRKVFMFGGSSSGWGPPVDQLRIRTSPSRPSNKNGHGGLEPVGGSQGEG